jgi:hypothetical protein
MGASFSLPMHLLHVTSMLIERLEHIPADSVWAHRASGIRGSLIKMVESSETGEIADPKRLEEYYLLGFRILELAAKEKY